MSELLRLHEALSDRYVGLEARLQEVVHAWKEDGLRIQGRFFYLPFQDGRCTQDEFLDYVWYRAVKFCTPAKVYEQKRQKFIETDDGRHYQEMEEEARSLFAKAYKSRPNTGEPGELILFVLLEGVLRAPQVVSKMHLKTSTQMHVHGADGVHVLYDQAEATLMLVWGESKLNKEAGAAVNQICESLKKFLTPQDGRTQRDREIEIVKAHISVKDEKLERELLKYLDPYQPESNNVADCHACFVGFDYGICKSVSELTNKAEVQRYFEDNYRERISSACTLFADKVRENKLDHLRFFFLLLPFASIDDLRQRFFRKIGVQE